MYDIFAPHSHLPRLARLVRLVRIVIGGALTVMTLTTAARADVVQDPPEKLLAVMLDAIKTDAYEDFLAEADPVFKTALSRQNFEGVASQIAPRLKGGWKAKHLAKLRQAGAATHVWKLEFVDGKDDVLARIVIKDKKVAGFWLQ